MPAGILDVDNVERSWMSLPGHDGSHSTSVSASSHHAEVAGVEGDGVLDLTRGNVHLDGIINLNIWKHYYISVENINFQLSSVDCGLLLSL